MACFTIAHANWTQTPQHIQDIWFESWTVSNFVYINCFKFYISNTLFLITNITYFFPVKVALVRR